MIMLYKDPSGSRVFTAHVKSLEIGALSQNGRQDNSDVYTLR